MRKLFIILIIIVLTLALGFYGYLEGIHIKRQSVAELNELLSGDYELFVPEGQGPFATVVGYHGCSGTLHGSRDWARLFQQAGYAVVLVESIKPRNLEWREVCDGKKLWGSERAGDVMASLETIRGLPFVNANALHLIGWSHGGWALMDAFDYTANEKRPPNLLEKPDSPLRGVVSATLFYPFCEFPVRARNGWPQEFPVHFIFAETDSIVSNAACQLIVDRQLELGKPVSAKSYTNTDHAFDMRPEDFYDGDLTGQPDATRQVHADMLINLRNWSLQ